MSTDEVERNGDVNGSVWSNKMDTNNNNRITDGSPNATTNQFCYTNTSPATANIPAYGGGAVSAHDVNLAQILYYQSLLKQQTTVASKLSSRNNALPQYSVLNSPSILPQVPGSPTNRSFAAALRNLAKQIGPGPNTSPERDNNVDSDSRQSSPKSRLSSSLLRNSSPTSITAKTSDKEKSSSNLENRSGFQPYRPDESRLSSSSSLSSQSSSSVTHAANPYGLDPATAAAFSPYHAAAAAAAAAAFYPAHMQHAYSRLEEQLYLERCGVSLFPPSPFTPSLYGMMPASLGLMSPAIHERLKLEEQERQRETLEKERERNEREKREKCKKNPRASPSHNHLNDHSARKASITLSNANNHRSQSPLSTNSPSLSSRLPQSSPTSITTTLPTSVNSNASLPFIRPFEDNYSPASRHSPSKTTASATKNSFLSTISDGISSSSQLTSATAGIPYSALSLSATKLSHPFECFSSSKTPDPPSAHMSSQTTTSPPVYMQNATNATDATPAAAAAPFLPVATAATCSNVTANSSFKPYPSYPYDLIQYPSFKNTMNYMSLCNTTASSPPLAKKLRPNSTISNGGGGIEATNNNDTICVKSTFKSNRNASGKSRSKNTKSLVDKRKSSTSMVSTIPTMLPPSTTDTNTIPLNLSTTNENLKVDVILEETTISMDENKDRTINTNLEEKSPSSLLALTEEVK